MFFQFVETSKSNKALLKSSLENPNVVINNGTANIPDYLLFVPISVNVGDNTILEAKEGNQEAIDRIATQYAKWESVKGLPKVEAIFFKFYDSALKSDGTYEKVQRSEIEKKDISLLFNATTNEYFWNIAPKGYIAQKVTPNSNSEKGSEKGKKEIDLAPIGGE